MCENTVKDVPECRKCNSGFYLKGVGNTRRCVKNTAGCRARNTMKKGS